MPFAAYELQAPTFNYVLAETVAETVQNGISYSDVNIKDVSSVTTDDDTSSSSRFRALSGEVLGASSSSLSVLYSVDISAATGFGGTVGDDDDDGYGNMGATLVDSVNDGEFSATLQAVASSVGASGFANVTSSSISVSYPAVMSTPTLSPTIIITRADGVAVVAAFIIVLCCCGMGVWLFFFPDSGDNKKTNRNEV